MEYSLMPKNSSRIEPIMFVNGSLLSEGEVITIRVALNSFAQTLEDDTALGDDNSGKRLVTAYKHNITSIFSKM